MLKQIARFACLAFFLFAASGNPLTANLTRSEFNGLSPYASLALSSNAASVQFDNPIPYPPMPPSCMPAPCPLGGVR